MWLAIETADEKYTRASIIVDTDNIVWIHAPSRIMLLSSGERVQLTQFGLDDFRFKMLQINDREVSDNDGKPL